jgi:hypothetical protein
MTAVMVQDKWNAKNPLITSSAQAAFLGGGDAIVSSFF